MLVTLTNGNKYYVPFICVTDKKAYICVGSTSQEYICVDKEKIFDVALIAT